jgi:hypothetical protein
MPECTFDVQQTALRPGRGSGASSLSLVRLASGEPESIVKATHALPSTGVPFSILGSYPGTDGYAG